MIKKEKVTELVNTHLAGAPHFLVEVVIRSGNRIMVLIDGDKGVGIDVCRELNQYLNKEMDRDQEDYDLTVSSAGADQALKLPRQFAKNIGKELEITTQEGEQFTGIVMEVDDQSIKLEKTIPKKQKHPPVDKQVTLTYREIKIAKEIITFKH